MASIIANEFTEATEAIYLSALFEIGLLLFVVSTVVNSIGKVIISRFSR
jgi:phosphate transport system permease protein